MNGSQGNRRRLVFLLALLCLLPAFPAPCATTWYVDGATSPSADGLTWATAKTAIQEAVDAASDSDAIWVAEGLYSEHVVLKSGLFLYGGFSKTETTPGDRDLSAHRTVLDGTGLTEGEILLVENVTSFVIDGFNTRNAADKGVYVNRAWDTGGLERSIRNCEFTGGAGAAVEISYAACAIENCYFGNNSGSGLFVYGNSQVTCFVRNCTFESGSAVSVMNDWYSGPEVSITNCLMAANYCGIYCQASSLSVTNCTITDNLFSGISCSDDWYFYIPPWLFPVQSLMPVYVAVPSDLYAMNCILSNNGSSGVYFMKDTYLTLRNNLFWGNAYAAQSDSYIANPVPILTGHWDYPTAADLDSAVFGARENLDGAPAFVNRAAGNYHLSRNSAAIDRGTGLGPLFDLDGAPRPVDTFGIGADGTGTEFDIGAYEYQDRVVYNPMAGQTYDAQLPIRWVESRLSANEVEISLYRDNQRRREIAASTANDGELNWPIPADCEPGGGCQVCVASAEDTGTLHFSGVFTITAGPPTLASAREEGAGRLRLDWNTARGPALAQLLGFAYDIYLSDWVNRGLNGTLWFPFSPWETSGLLDVFHTGAYHAWISGQWTDGTWLPCLNPRTLIVYSGTPHTPAGVWVEDKGGGVWRLHWTPEIYGTWLDQIIVFQNGVGWIAPTDGPSSAFPQFSPWTFLDYAGFLYDPTKASFLEGWADLTLPAEGSYIFCLNFRAWDAATQGPSATAAAN